MHVDSVQSMLSQVMHSKMVSGVCMLVACIMVSCACNME